MTSGKIKDKPSDTIRKNLEQRALKARIQAGEGTGFKLSENAKKSPSQRKSESMKKKLARNAERSLK